MAAERGRVDHYTGSIVYVGCEKDGGAIIIDGRQRLVTVTLLLAAIHRGDGEEHRRPRRFHPPVEGRLSSLEPGSDAYNAAMATKSNEQTKRRGSRTGSGRWGQRGPGPVDEQLHPA